MSTAFLYGMPSRIAIRQPIRFQTNPRREHAQLHNNIVIPRTETNKLTMSSICVVLLPGLFARTRNQEQGAFLQRPTGNRINESKAALVHVYELQIEVAKQLANAENEPHKCPHIQWQRQMHRHIQRQRQIRIQRQ